MSLAASSSFLPYSPKAHTDESPLTSTVVALVTAPPAISLPPWRRTHACNIFRGNHAFPVNETSSPLIALNHFLMSVVRLNSLHCCLPKNLRFPWLVHD